MTYLRNSKKLPGAIALLVMAGVAVTALAAEIANVPASTCIPANGGQLSIGTDGQVANNTASSVTAVCPADRKLIGSAWATRFWARTFVVDQHSTQNVCCRVYSKNPSGGLVSGTDVCSTGESSSHQILDMPTITDGTTWSHFFVQCTLPPLEGSASKLQTVRTHQE